MPAGSPLAKFYKEPDAVWTPRVLKDGADSVGALGALNRVFINIGLFSEEWLEHFNPLVGGKKITPIPIKVARKNSVYWQANENQTPNLALFFLATAKPDYLKNAPGNETYLTADAATLTRGKAAFSERCARCHSSKLPEKAYTFFPNNGCVGPDYLNCWNRYWAWTKTDEFKGAIKEIVRADDFLQDNFLSTELRVPVTLLETMPAVRSRPTPLRATSGTTFPPNPTKISPRWERSRCITRSLESPGSTECPQVVAVTPDPPR